MEYGGGRGFVGVITTWIYLKKADMIKWERDTRFVREKKTGMRVRGIIFFCTFVPVLRQELWTD